MSEKARDSQKCLCSSQKAKHCDICQSQATNPSGTKSLVHSFESQSIEKEEEFQSGISGSQKLQSAESSQATEEACSGSACSTGTSSKQPMLEQKRSIKVLITGRSGNGKSVIINGLAGQKVIPERVGVRLEPRSETLEYYHRFIGNVHLRVWSSAHLQDQDKRINKHEYLKSLKDSCSDVHIIIYCLNMNETRFLPGNPDINAMKTLTELFGEKCWKKTIFALTYANIAAVGVFAPDDYDDDSKETDSEKAKEAKYRAFTEGILTWKDIIEDVLRNDINVTIPLEIKAVPTGHYKKPTLPDRLCWLSQLFMDCGVMMPKEAQEALVEMNFRRFKDSRHFKSDDAERKKSYEQQISVTFDALKKGYSSLIHLIKRKPQ